MSDRIEGTCTITGQIIKRTEKALLVYIEAERNNFWVPKSQVDNIYPIADRTKEGELGSVEDARINDFYAIRIPMWLGCKIGHVDTAEELEDADLSFISID